MEGVRERDPATDARVVREGNDRVRPDLEVVLAGVVVLRQERVDEPKQLHDALVLPDVLAKDELAVEPPIQFVHRPKPALQRRAAVAVERALPVKDRRRRAPEHGGPIHERCAVSEHRRIQGGDGRRVRRRQWAPQHQGNVHVGRERAEAAVSQRSDSVAAHHALLERRPRVAHGHSERRPAHTGHRHQLLAAPQQLRLSPLPLHIQKNT